MECKILIGELVNLMTSHPVNGGDTISHSSMKAIVDAGFATTNDQGQYIPTEEGLWVWNQFGCQTITIKSKHEFNF